MYGLGIIKSMKATGKYFFRKKVTQYYPDEPADLQERFRGSFDLIEDKCIACSLCVRACTNQVIRLKTSVAEDKKRKLEEYIMDLDYCLFCGLCVEACPTQALVWNQEFELACFSREQLIHVYKEAKTKAAEER